MKKELFNDFCLLELSHLTIDDIFNYKKERTPSGTAPITKVYGVKRTASKERSKRLAFGKKIIDTETKAGDLVLIESPEQYTLEDFKKHYAGTPFELFGNTIVKEIMNFYSELAKYAESKGRKVQSLEPGVFRPGSRLYEAIARLSSLPLEKIKRVEYLTTHRRDYFMQKRIQVKKPALVIVARGHAVRLENAMKPKKTIYLNPLAPARKVVHLNQIKKITEQYIKEKKERREKIVRRLGLKPR